MTIKGMRQWHDHFAALGIDPELAASILAHVEALRHRGLPPILELGHLALLLGRSEAYLASVINATDRHYRTFQMKKRSGGYREISAPYPALLECQQWIVANVLVNLKHSVHAHGFIQERSIVTNATIHTGTRHLLKLDLLDFFPSIHFSRVVTVFTRLGYSTRVAIYLAKICTLHGSLPQGAASSPAISNAVCLPLDIALARLARRFGIRFSRYADDLAFSGDRIPRRFATYAESTISRFGFQVNTAKTVICRGGGRRVVTGISVKGAKIALPRSYKRELRRDLHYVRKFGVISHSAKRRIGDPFLLERLLGKINHWLHVEPDCAYAVSAKNDLISLLRNRNALQD